MKQTKYTATFGKTYTVRCFGFFEAFSLIASEMIEDGRQVPIEMLIENEYGTVKLLTLSIS